MSYNDYVISHIIMSRDTIYHIRVSMSYSMHWMLHSIDYWPGSCIRATTKFKLFCGALQVELVYIIPPIVCLSYIICRTLTVGRAVTPRTSNS